MEGLFPSLLPSKVSDSDGINSSWLVNNSFTSPLNTDLISSSLLHYPFSRNDNKFAKYHHDQSIENSIYLLDTHQDLKLLEFGTIQCQIPKYESEFEPQCLSLVLTVNQSPHLNFEHRRYFTISPSITLRTIKYDAKTFDFRSSFIQLKNPVSPLLCRRHSNSQNQLEAILPFFESFDPEVVTIQNWLEQFIPLAQLRISNNLNFFSPETLEAILVALESAFSFHPCYIPLISKFMSYYSLVYPYQRIFDKWKKFLFILPQCSRLWNEFINFISQSFDHFFVDDAISVYTLAIKRLISILERNILSSPPEFEAENNLIILIVKYCYFLKNAGYRERAISSIISLIQFNYMKRLTNIHKESLIDQFIENWNGNCISMLHNIESNKFLSEIPVSSDNVDYSIIDSSLILRSWTEIERMKMDSWVFPFDNQQITNFALDRQKYIHHSQLTHLFFTIHDVRHNFELVLHVFILIGVPISFTSLIGDTYISDSEMIVKIGAKEWISLSPLKFTGLVIIDSTCTKNVSHQRSILKKEQLSSLSNFLNLVIPTIDLELQTVILLIWFEYLINCLEHSITNIEFNVKISRQIKFVLAIDAHRNNLDIWAAYLIIQSYVSSLTEVFKIPIMLFTQYNNTDYSIEILFCVCILLHLCTIVESRFCIDTSNLELYFIDSLTSKLCPDYTKILNFCQDTGTKFPYSYSQYLISKQVLWDRLIHSLERSSFVINSSLPYSFIFLHAEINLTNSVKFNERCLIIGAIIESISNSNLSCEERNRYMDFVLYTGIYLIKRRNRLIFFPKSLVIALRQLGGDIIYRNPGLYAFLIQSYKTTDNIEFSSDGITNNCYLGKISFQFSRINQENNSSIKMNNINLLGEIFDHAIVTHPNSLILWVAYLDYLSVVGNVDDIRLGFLQAIKKAPGVKHFYMQYLHTKYSDLMLAISTMEEKGIRINFPIEEYILIQKNCNHS